MLNTREGLSDPGDFEKPFRDKLTDLEGVPPQESWNTIQTALDRDRGIDRRWYLLVLLLLVGGGGFIGGYWVSWVKRAHERTVVVDGDGQFQILDSKSHSLNPESGHLVTGEDCVEICIDDVDVLNASSDVEAKRLDLEIARNSGDQSVRGGDQSSGDAVGISSHRRTAKSYNIVAMRNEAHAENGDVGGDDVGNVREADTRHAKGTLAPTHDSDGARISPPDTLSAVWADQRMSTRSRTDDDLSNAMPQGSGKKTPGHDTVHATGQSETQEPKDADEGSDSTVLMLNGPLRPLYPHHDGMAAAAVVGADSVQKEEEIAAATMPDAADSVVEKKKEVEPGKWTLQISVGGNYVFKKLAPSEDLYYLTGLTNKNKFSWYNAGYHLAARLRRDIGAKTTLIVGVSWSRWQTYIGYNYYDVVADSIAVQQITANSIEVNTYFMKRSNEIHTTVQQVGLSVGVLRKVQLLQRSHTILLEANLYQKIYATTQSGQGGHNVSIRPMHFALKAGVEKTVDIGAWRFTLTPYMQHYLDSLYTAESMFQFSPLQVGLDVGFLLPLQKK